MKKISFYALLLSIIMVSCYPDGPTYTSDLDLVFTNYNENFNFQGTGGTYAMPDSVVIISGTIEDGEPPEFIKEPYNTQILDRIAKNMSDMGWQRVPNTDNADLVLLPASWTNTTIVYWYNYWCWYWYYYCGWGYYPSATSITTGSLVMGLIAYGDDYIEPDRVWGGALNGILSGSFNYDRVMKGIDQAFTQSPYLNIK